MTSFGASRGISWSLLSFDSEMLKNSRLCHFFCNVPDCLVECRAEDGKSMKSFSLLQVLRVGVLLYEWLDIPFLKRYYDFGFDHYNLQWHKAGITGLLDTLFNRSGPFVHDNWVLPDLSIQSSVELNKKLRTFDKTFYFRCVKWKNYFDSESCRILFWKSFNCFWYLEQIVLVIVHSWESYKLDSYCVQLLAG